jgi:hypothetical protein
VIVAISNSLDNQTRLAMLRPGITFPSPVRGRLVKITTRGPVLALLFSGTRLNLPRGRIK